ncbi:MAG: hypothetical protein RJA70_2645, partial [Pseudomonadota bacterium]
AGTTGARTTVGTAGAPPGSPAPGNPPEPATDTDPPLATVGCGSASDGFGLVSHAVTSVNMQIAWATPPPRGRCPFGLKTRCTAVTTARMVETPQGSCQARRLFCPKRKLIRFRTEGRRGATYRAGSHVAAVDFDSPNKQPRNRQDSPRGSDLRRALRRVSRRRRSSYAERLEQDPAENQPGDCGDGASHEHP